MKTTKTQSRWIQHVMAYAQEKGIKYNEALKDPDLKVGYVKVERVKKQKEQKMSEPKMEMKSEPPMKVKKERKKKDVMVMVVEPQPMMQELITVVEEPKKVRAKRSKKEPAMM